MTTLQDIKVSQRGWEVQRLMALYNAAKKSRLLNPADKQTIMTIANTTLKQATGRDMQDRQ